MPKYNVVWSERMSIEVEAKNEKEAREIVLNCEHDESQVSSELDMQPEVYKINNVCGVSGCHNETKDGNDWCETHLLP